jgi:hypothetical protein
MLTFPVALVKDATNVLRHAGFRFSKVKPDWEPTSQTPKASPRRMVAPHGALPRVPLPPSERRRGRSR